MKLVTLTILATIILLIAGCAPAKHSPSITSPKPPNNPPIIENLTVTPKEPKYMKEIVGGYKILKGKSCDIECVASDPDNDELLYEWSTDGGNVSGEGSAITWTAPLRGGEFTIAVTVSDNSGGIASKKIVFQVKTCACAFR
jgi:hypothetical protein